MPHLDVRELEVAFGRVPVLHGVNIQVPAGGRVALLGTNGAGKSTLVRAVAGLIPTSGGSVHLDGSDVTALPTERRVVRGLALIEGGRATFPSLSVEQNLRLAAFRDRRRQKTVDGRLEEALDLFPHLRPRLRQRSGTLSGGEQQMVAVGRAWMTDASLVVFDELSLGLAPAVMEAVIAGVRRLGDQGRSLLVVEQSLDVASALADHAYFLERGEVRFFGPVDELAEREDLARSVFLRTDGDVS